MSENFMEAEEYVTVIAMYKWRACPLAASMLLTALHPQLSFVWNSIFWFNER